MIYEFDHIRFATNVLPSFLRKPRMIAFIAALISPLITIYQAFNSERQRLSVEINYNSQELLFSFVLNNLFDATQRRIIVETNTAVGLYVGAYLQAEGQQKVGAYLQSENAGKVAVGLFEEAISIDFYIKIPAAILAMQETPLRRIVEKYKLAGKTYEFIAI